MEKASHLGRAVDLGGGYTGRSRGDWPFPLRHAGRAKADFRIRSRLVLAILGGALMGASSGAVAQSADAGASQDQANAFQQQAARLGVQRCGSLFAVLGEAATLGSTYAVQVKADGAAPDNHRVIGVAGLTYDSPQYRGQAAGVAIAAPTPGGCEGQMVRVAPFEQACAEVVALLPAGSTVETDLSGVPLYNLGVDQGQALLLTSGPGCVVVTVGPTLASR